MIFGKLCSDQFGIGHQWPQEVVKIVRHLPGDPTSGFQTLSAGGEFLGLYDNSQEPKTVFDPDYPVQRPDAAYGYDTDNDSYTDLQSPTPGEVNAPPVAR